MRAPMRFLLAALALLWLAAPAAATPVTYTIDMGSSTLSANVSATMDISVNTNLGTVNGDASANGSLSSAPNGDLTVDWGVPNTSWNNQLTAGPGDVNINTGPAGQATGGATLDLFGFLPVNFDLTIDVNNITLGLGSNFASQSIGDAPGVPGTGPWVAGDTVDLLLGASVDFNASGPFGINIGNNGIGIGPETVSGMPLAVTLSRTGGIPGTGSELNLTIPPGLDLSLPPQPTSNFGAPGCDVSVLLICNLNVTSVYITLTSLDFTDVTGTIIANSSAVIPLPEASAAMLLLSGAAGGVVLARRRR